MLFKVESEQRMVICQSDFTQAIKVFQIRETLIAANTIYAQPFQFWTRDCNWFHVCRLKNGVSFNENCIQTQLSHGIAIGQMSIVNALNGAYQVTSDKHSQRLACLQYRMNRVFVHVHIVNVQIGQSGAQLMHQILQVLVVNCSTTFQVESFQLFAIFRNHL